MLELVLLKNSHQSCTLSYKASSKELNELQLTFNRMARAMQIAQLKTSSDAEALLNY